VGLMTSPSTSTAAVLMTSPSTSSTTISKQQHKKAATERAATSSGVAKYHSVPCDQGGVLLLLTNPVVEKTNEISKYSNNIIARN